MPLGTEVGLSPDDTVLDGDPAPPPTKRGTAAPHKSNSMSANECILFMLCRVPCRETDRMLHYTTTPDRTNNDIMTFDM